MTDTVPRLKAPAGATDTHIHIYDKRYPLAPTATFNPPDALVADYLAMCKRVGIERTVVVQPTAYGTDNRCTLESIGLIGADRARGIAVVDDTIADEELDCLHKAGIRGVRFFMLPGGVLPWGKIQTVAQRVQPFGWHAIVQFDGREFEKHEPALAKLPGTLVIDHVGKFLEPVPVDHPAFRAMLRFLENGRTYVKLAAPYETSRLGPPYYDDVGALAKALVRAAPNRMLWASNWPQPNPPRNVKPDNAVMLDLLLDWAPDDATRTKILVDNPARLYGFD